MEGDEGLIYNYIKDSANEGELRHLSHTIFEFVCDSCSSGICPYPGIWTKTLKARSNLHQTIINRCLKSLEQKQLVKSIKSVKVSTAVRTWSQSCGTETEPTWFGALLSSTQRARSTCSTASHRRSKYRADLGIPTTSWIRASSRSLPWLVCASFSRR